MSKNIVEVITEVLGKVEVPGFDVDLMSSGVVRSFRLSKDGRKVVVFVDFLTSDPGCLFCKFINHTLWTTIARNIRDTLVSSSLFDEVLVVDEFTKAPLT
ncbi:MAG: hypothetical protein ACK416_05400 [Zestosphaera sp.]